jgi:hypothetical protein
VGEVVTVGVSSRGNGNAEKWVANFYVKNFVSNLPPKILALQQLRFLLKNKNLSRLAP